MFDYVLKLLKSQSRRVLRLGLCNGAHIRIWTYSPAGVRLDGSFYSVRLNADDQPGSAPSTLLAGNCRARHLRDPPEEYLHVIRIRWAKDPTPVKYCEAL